VKELHTIVKLLSWAQWTSTEVLKPHATWFYIIQWHGLWIGTCQIRTWNKLWKLITHSGDRTTTYGNNSTIGMAILPVGVDIWSDGCGCRCHFSPVDQTRDLPVNPPRKSVSVDARFIFHPQISKILDFNSFSLASPTKFLLALKFWLTPIISSTQIPYGLWI
jgi:hypothetical protein